MELNKINEAYTLTDITKDNWKVSGQAIKENDGSISINFSVTDNNTLDYKHLGNYGYNIPIDGQSVSVNYNCRKECYETFIKYSENLILQILEQL